MRIAVFIAVLCISYVADVQSAIGMETVTRCELGSDQSHTLALLRDHPIDSTAVFYLSKDSTEPVRLYAGDEDQSRGDEIQVACIGSTERVFVISGEFTSNYLQGVAIRYNTKAGRWERVDFAERERPASVYLDPKGLVVLIPNSGRNESPERYIIYRYDADAGRAKQAYSDYLPHSGVIQIPAPKNRPE
ncbi:hypothetical protein LJ655_00560 [Paraburkholderia sp. MMS20-SJTN17]|uniref:Uncharacterized protein n=1 Tax=Paraburkholderia translucens TaxID=2886945 RepID=A0ABS8K6N5_9BURK|nr:hypothetical protein [Paraburkholderia sp. MMS20-SJTN17]MCC8400395.1 hypothetical protein [Paraburkholderia sp. MMS20-SJTN17]